MALPVLREWTDERPTNYYRDCVGRVRPCPWVGCKYHRFIDVTEAGSMTFALNPTSVRGSIGGRGRNERLREQRGRALAMRRFGTQGSSAEGQVMDALERAADEGEPTCVLDLVEGGETFTLDQIGDFIGVTRERARQIEMKAVARLRAVQADHPELAEFKGGIEHPETLADAWERWQ